MESELITRQENEKLRELRITCIHIDVFIKQTLNDEELFDI